MYTRRRTHNSGYFFRREIMNNSLVAQSEFLGYFSTPLSRWRKTRWRKCTNRQRTVVPTCSKYIHLVIWKHFWKSFPVKKWLAASFLYQATANWHFLTPFIFHQNAKCFFQLHYSLGLQEKWYFTTDNRGTLSNILFTLLNSLWNVLINFELF